MNQGAQGNAGFCTQEGLDGQRSFGLFTLLSEYLIAAMTVFSNDMLSGLPHFVGVRLGISSVLSDVNHFKHVLN